ncbi:MAG: pilus assembly protein CpaB [Nocardioides sp.]|nr:pilus assembly protein CpaB [Nocardioides sp.]
MLAVRRRVRRAVLRRRRLLAAVLTAVAAVAGLRATAPPPQATVSVLVAAHDLPAGTRLADADLTTLELRPGTEPDGLVPDPTGSTLASALRRGEPVTDARVLGPALTDGHADMVATPVRLPDPAMASLLRAGDRVDVLAADPQGGPTQVLAESALVLAVPAPSDDAVADALPGRLVVLGLDGSEVPEVAGASVTRFLSVAYSD